MFKTFGGNLIFRDNYLHNYLQCAMRYNPFTEMRVNVDHIYRNPLHFSPSRALLWTAIYTRTKVHDTHPLPALYTVHR